MPTIDQQIREFQKHLRDTVNSPEFGKRYTPSEQVRIRGEFKKMLSTLADYQSRRDQADVAETADRENQALAEARKKTRAERNPLLNILGDLGTGVAETFAFAPATLAGLGLDIVGADDTAKTIAQGVADWREALETSLPSPEWNANNPESMLPGSDFIFGTAARNLAPMLMTGRATNAATRGLQALKGAPLSKGLQRAVNIGGTALGMSLPETYRDAMTTDQLGNVQLPKSPLTAMAMSVPHAAIEQLGVTPARLATLGNRSFIDALKRYARRHGVAGAAKHLVKHVAGDAISESMEEPMQGVVGIFNRHLVNKDFGQGIEDAVAELSQPETWSDLYQQSVGGLTTGALYSGGHIALGKINKKIEDPKTPVTEKQQLAMTKERLQIENQALLQLPYAGDASTVLPDGSSITDVPTEPGRQALNITSILPDGTPVYGEGAVRLNSPVLNDQPLLPSQATQELLPAPPSAVELGNMFLQTHARGDQVGAQALRDYAENRGALVTTPRVKVETPRGGDYSKMDVRVEGIQIPTENRTLIRGDSEAAARLEKKIPQQQSNVTLPPESNISEKLPPNSEVFPIHDHFDKETLAEVKAEMKRRGAPTIRVVDMGDGEYAAIEGTHRLRAAKELGLTPKIIKMDYESIKDLDVTDPALKMDMDNPGMTIADLMSDYNRRKPIEFADQPTVKQPEPAAEPKAIEPVNQPSNKVPTRDEFFDAIVEGSMPRRMRSDRGSILIDSRSDRIYWYDIKKGKGLMPPPGARAATYGEYVDLLYDKRYGKAMPVVSPKPAPEVPQEKPGVNKAPETTDRKHSFSNTDITVPKAVADKMLDLGKSIPDSELYIDKDDPSYGRETRAHVTVRYGLDTDNPADLKRLSEMPPIKVRMGDVSIFETDNYDVVKVDVDSPELRAANKMVGELVAVPGETHKDYKPHATIAYVKKGEGKKYVGNKTLSGQTFEIDEINLVDRTGKEHKIKLAGFPTLEVFKGDDITFQFPDGRTEGAYVQDATPVTRDGTPDQIYVKLDANGALRYLPKSWITKVKPSLIRQNKMDLAATEAKREAEAAKPKPEKTPAATPGKIEDFGEVLHGAKKHYAEAYKDKLKASESVDEAVEPLSKSWPEPNYEQMIKDGADPIEVGLVRALRDLVPNKPPRGSRKMGRYLSDLRSNKAKAALILEGKRNLDQLKAFLENDRTAHHYAKLQTQPFSEAEGLAILYATVGHKKSLKGTRIAVARFSLFEGKEQNPPLDLFTIEQPGKSSPFFNMPRNLGRGPVLSEAIGQFKKNYDTAIQAPVEKSTRQTRIDVYKKAIGPNSGKFFLGHKIRATVLELKFFETSKEAREYLQANRAELEKMIADRKKTTTGRREENLPRTGKDLRDGRDITPAEFSSTFGFRGVQFGNWVEGQKRQENINEAYDALMDLAAALNIPPIAISLNGELGLAFGARGRGGERAAAAHYEQDSAVINLTKKRGAGSLAHEWLHGLDNFLAKGKAGISKSFYLSNDSRLSTARPEVAEAFNNLMKAINNTGLPARSKELDKTRSKDYWSTNVEMAARTFESYILRKLDASGIRNDFLVNTMGESSNAEDNKAFPYILESEIPTIIDTFDNLFNTLKQEKTEKGVKLYSVEYLVAKFAADGMKQAARVVRFGGNLLAKNVTKFAAWAKSMLKEFGSKIGKQLRSLYADLQALNKKLGRTGAISGRQVGLKNSDAGQSSPVSGKTAHEVLTAKWTKPKTSSTKKDTPSGQNVKSDKPRGKSPTELKQMVTSRGLVWKRVDKDTYELELTDPNTGKTSVVETIRRPKGTDNIWSVDNWTTFDDRGTGSGSFTNLKVAKAAIKAHARDAFNQKIYRDNAVIKDRQRDETLKKKRERGLEQDKVRDEREAKQHAEKKRKAQEYFAEKKTEPDNEPKKPKTWRDYAKNFIEKAEEILFDAWAPVRRLQESILKKHDVKELQDDLNLYQKLEVVSGKIEAGTRIFKSKFFDPIEKYLVENKIDYKSANRFLAIMHAEERNDAVAERNETYRITGKPGSGISSEQAAKEIEAHKKNGTYDKYLKFAKMTYRLNNALLDEQVRYGLLSQEQRDAYRRYKNYTPMKSPPDQGLILDRMALGRRSEATDQLTYIKAAVEAVFRRGERRDVIGAAMKLFAKFPDQKLYREFEPPKVQYIDKQTGKVRLRTDMSKLYNNPAVIWMKEAGAGVMRAFEIKDAALASALNRQYSGLGVEQKAFRYFAGVNRFLAGVSTAYNPEFIFTNLLRDIQQGAASVGVNLPDGSVKKFMTNLSRAKKAIADTRAGKITDDTKALEEFQLAGGKTGYSEFSKLEAAAEDLERKISEAQAGGRWYKTRQAKDAVLDWIADWNDDIETRTRFAGYLTAKEAGLSTQKSAAFAKGMTINFNKKGTWAPVFNSLYLFSSASLGGTMVTASIINKARKTSKGRIMLAGAVGLGFVMELLNRAIAGDDDDEGVNYYDKVPDYIKDSNYVFMIPGTKGKYFAIPMPYGLNVLPAVGRNMAASMFGAQSFGTGAANVAGAILNSFNPVGGDNRGLGFQAIPTAVRPFIDIATNTSWTGRKIRPDQPAFGSKVARSELYFDQESKILTAATRTLNELTGGDRYTGGLVSLSPADVSHLLESYTGGVGRTLSRGFDTAARITSGEAPDFDNVPVVRRFGGGATDYNTRQTFKENSEIVEDFERARRERDTEYLKSNRRLLPAVALYKNTGKRITAIRKRKTLSESDKQKQIIATQKIFNKRFREFQEKSLSKN